MTISIQVLLLKGFVSCIFFLKKKKFFKTPQTLEWSAYGIFVCHHRNKFNNFCLMFIKNTTMFCWTFSFFSRDSSFSISTYRFHIKAVIWLSSVHICTCWLGYSYFLTVVVNFKQYFNNFAFKTSSLVNLNIFFKLHF